MDPLFFRVPRLEQNSIRIESWDLPHFFDPIHYHEDCQITFILEGEGTLIAGHSMSPFQPGDILLFGKNLPHVLRNNERYYAADPAIHARAVSIFFNETIFREITDRLPELNHLNHLISAMKYGLKIPAGHSVMNSSRLEIEMNNKGVQRILFFMDLLNQISLSQSIKRISTSISDVSNRKNSIILNRVFEYILDNYNKKIILQDVAVLANMTPNAFCRFFKSRTHKTFFTHLIEVRINMICKLLSEGNLNVTESYMACGYDNSSNFHRHFKKVIGLTPREYLQKVNNLLN